MATNMENSLLFYDLPNMQSLYKDFKDAGKSNEGLTSFHEDSLPDISTDLNPAFESVQNIQELIDTEGILFPELFSSGSVAENSSDQPQAWSSAKEEEFVNLQVVNDPMPVVFHSDPQVTTNQGSDSIIVIRPDDLAALGVTLSGDLQLEPEAVLDTSAIEIDSTAIEFDVELEESLSGLEELQFSSVSTSSIQTPYERRVSGSGKSGRRSRHCDKGSDEYRHRRQKNNIAVRKSRDKAKIRQQETEGKVNLLTRENDRLLKKVDLLTKELTVLKGLFTNVGATIPAKLAALLR